MRAESERLVRESWAQFEPVAEQSAAFFYDKLFELDPECPPALRLDQHGGAGPQGDADVRGDRPPPG